MSTIRPFHLGEHFLAEAGHALLGALCTLAPLALFPQLHHGALYGAAAVFAYATVKEFTFDLIVEHATVKDGFVDLAFFGIGISGSLFLAFIFRHSL